MRCIKCYVDLHTRYLGICEKCRTISWSPKYINKNLKSICKENNIEFNGLEGFVKQTNLIQQAINKCINGGFAVYSSKTLLLMIKELK